MIAKAAGHVVYSLIKSRRKVFSYAEAEKSKRSKESTRLSTKFSITTQTTRVTQWTDVNDLFHSSNLSFIAQIIGYFKIDQAKNFFLENHHHNQYQVNAMIFMLLATLI